MDGTATVDERDRIGAVRNGRTTPERGGFGAKSPKK